MKYRAEIDGLRAFAVIPVILFHAGFELFSGGFVGVDVFFVISGYLITTILIEDLEHKRFSIVNFYERRARRILPALYTVVLSSAAISSITLYPEYLVSFAKSLIAAPTFSANFYFWSERGYFGESSDLKPLIHLWSLAVEEQFYIVFPLVLLLIRKSQAVFYVVLAFGFVCSIASSYYVTKLHFDTAFYFPFTRAWELLAGSLAALILRKGSVNFKRHEADIISLFGLLLILYSYLTFNNQTPFPGVYALIPVTGTFLFVISASSSIFLKKIFAFKPLVFLGLLSFSLYLWHQPIFAIARHASFFDGNFIALSILVLMLSYFTYRYVESPFRDKSLISTTRVFFLSILGGVLLIVLGVFIIINDGFPERYSSEDRAILKQLSNYQGYNQKAFDSLQLNPFVDNGRPRVVIVGDSYAKDLMNIFLESGRFSDVQFSTRQVNSECGNLYLESYEPIEQHIPLNRLERCRVLGWYKSDAFHKILSEADEIWLASSWNSWVIDYLPHSINRLSEEYSVPIRVFGIKNFGVVSPYEMLSVPFENRSSFTQTVLATTQNVSKKLASALAEYEYFYPLLEPLCGGDGLKCRIFTTDGLLMSADGGHLTREGAFESAKRLSATLNNISSSLQE